MWSRQQLFEHFESNVHNCTGDAVYHHRGVGRTGTVLVVDLQDDRGIEHTASQSRPPLGVEVHPGPDPDDRHYVDGGPEVVVADQPRNSSSPREPKSTGGVENSSTIVIAVQTIRYGAVRHRSRQIITGQWACLVRLLLVDPNNVLATTPRP